jgi:inner membrane protein involved in colicin E2 resistance
VSECYVTWTQSSLTVMYYTASDLDEIQRIIFLVVILFVLLTLSLSEHISFCLLNFINLTESVGIVRQYMLIRAVILLYCLL